MLLKRSLFNTFMLVTLVAVSSCVPKATEKKAVCGENESFNSVTRSCYSIVEPRYKPVATKSSDTLSEETPKTITLTYTDANKDQAISCKVSAIASNIEAVSPLVLNGGLVNKAGELYNMTSNLSGAIPAPDAASATAANNAIFAALELIRNSASNATITTQLGIIKSQTDILLILAQNHPSDVTIQTFKTITQEVLTEFEPVAEQVVNRCECSAGVCTTTISPKLHKSGASGFSYTITDQDGESPSKAVTLSISAMSTSTAHLAPVAKSAFGSYAESTTSTASSYTVTIPTAGDIAGTPATSFRYYFRGTKNGSNQGLTTKGKVTGCMDLTGSTGLNDTSCVYTPNSGDEYSTTVGTKASAVIDDLTYTAVSEGTIGNSYTIQYFNLQEDNSAVDPYVTKASSFGLVSTTYNESFLRVVGNSIRVFINYNITSSTDIKNLINAHPQASRLVQVSGGSSAHFPFPGGVTPSAVSLSGGINAYDTIPYKVNNLLADSADASFQVDIVSQNDFPMVPKTYNSLFSQSETLLEESTKNLTLGFTDVDNTSGFTVTAKVDAASPTCSAVTDAGYLVMGASTYFSLGAFSAETCTASGVCTVNVDLIAGLNFTGNACLYYQVTDAFGLKSQVQSVNISVTGVNDTPLLSSAVLPTITPLPDTSTNEDLVAPLLSYSNIYVGPGGDVYEASQILTVTASSSNTVLLPNTPCQNYTPGTATPVGAIVPSGAGAYYFDTTNLRCYVSTGTSSNDWKLYPSLTVFPNCLYDYSGQGSPLGVVSPSTSGKRYLDTTNNKCYVSSSSTSSSWSLDTTISHYKIAYVPATDKSGFTDITVTVKDNGGTANGAVDTVSDVFRLTVNWIDDPPVFKQSITSVQTNEGGDVQSDGFIVDEDAGATTDEDAQGIRISSITTDNASVLPTSSISIFYDLNDNGVEDDGEERGINQVLEAAAADDARAHKFYLKLDPVDGVSGNANVTLTITDGTTPVSTSFSFIVNPIAALHGGWNNISSTGLKADKGGAPVASAEIQCNYNQSTDTQKCGTGANCTGATTPHSTVVPTAANVIFWDSANKRCYRSTSASEYSWVEFNTSCPVTRQAGVCSGNNCIINDTPTNLGMIASFVGQYAYDSNSKTCFVSTGKTLATEWQVYVPARVTLAWKPFTMVGSGPESGVQIAGWNVYRREHGTDYNFKGGHLKNTSSTSVFTIADPSVRTFTDTTAIAGKVYFYVVRPVDNRRNFPTHTPEIYSEVRVLAAPTNYAFVHRWIVNQEVCNSMNITTTTSSYSVDMSNNFRCPYIGPGTSAGYYDYGRDLLVDSQEVGCPYAAAPKCTSNGCVGIGAPSATSGIATDDLYYDRGAGVCYRYNGASWAAFDTAFAISGALANSLNSALNAPLVNVKQARAAAICSARTAPAVPSVVDASSATVAAATFGAAQLPNKKDYIGYSSHAIGVADPDITDMEQGFSLNIQSRCNGSSASGLETAYTDSAIPSTSFIYSLPGSASSGIRSLYTGSIAWGSSKGTEACVSRFGIQDLYGNVAEWTTDQMNCPANYLCTAVAGSSYASYDFDPVTAGTQAYGFDMKSGPYNDADGDGTTAGTDAWLTQWAFADQLFGASKFSLPLALPINGDIDSATAYDNTPALPWLLNIGPSSGITTTKLHEDGIIINGSTIAGTGSFAVGGSYLSGNLAGRYSSELVPAATARSDIGLRCIIPVSGYASDSKHTYSY